MHNAAVVELVDTLDSKSCERKLVTVQVRPAAPDYSYSTHFTSVITGISHPLRFYFNQVSITGLVSGT